MVVVVLEDDDGAERFLAKKLPTVKQYTSARHGPRDNDGFRWAPGAFRKYGVTKAEVILWLLKAGRDVCMSDVDAAWIAPPCAARLAARNSARASSCAIRRNSAHFSDAPHSLPVAGTRRRRASTLSSSS